MGQSDDKVAAVATVLYLLFLPLYPITASLMGEGTSNVVIAVATVVNVLVTAVYAFFTWRLWRETRPAALTAAGQIRLTRVEQGLRLRPYVAIEAEIDFPGRGAFAFRFNSRGQFLLTSGGSRDGRGSIRWNNSSPVAVDLAGRT